MAARLLFGLICRPIFLLKIDILGCSMFQMWWRIWVLGYRVVARSLHLMVDVFWVCKHDSSGSYSVKSAYLALTVVWSIDTLVEKLKLSSWKWFLAKILVNPTPSMSGRCNLSCAGADRGWWGAGIGC
ncbi:hypothetical protein A2U01_0002620 [Trifolium medium]|uniref:Uncharacterized protein n=1 Tax=Trifolium medium TaxID=97028 RepID=A0A392M3A5_9FABA|nr:hypothetical protein [Trifolium medium]